MAVGEAGKGGAGEVVVQLVSGSGGWATPLRCCSLGILPQFARCACCHSKAPAASRPSDSQALGGCQITNLCKRPGGDNMAVSGAICCRGSREGRVEAAATGCRCVWECGCGRFQIRSAPHPWCCPAGCTCIPICMNAGTSHPETQSLGVAHRRQRREDSTPHHKHQTKRTCLKKCWRQFCRCRF